MNRMCQNKETAGLFGGNKSCPVTKCIGTDVFFSFFHLIINCVQRWFLLLPLSCHAPRLQGITESHRTGSRIPHPHPNTTITPVIASKPLHALPLSFPKIYKKKHLLKEHPNTPLSHQEVVLITHKCFPPVWLLLPNERFYIYTVYVWMKPLRLDLTAAYGAAPDHGKSFKKWGFEIVNILHEKKKKWMNSFFQCLVLVHSRTGEPAVVVYKSPSAAKCPIKPIWKWSTVGPHRTLTAVSTSVRAEADDWTPKRETALWFFPHRAAEAN